MKRSVMTEVWIHALCFGKNIFLQKLMGIFNVGFV